MPGPRRSQPGIDGTAYGCGYHAYTLKARLGECPIKSGGWWQKSWEAGWLDARDEWEAFYKRDTEAKDLARAI